MHLTNSENVASRIFGLRIVRMGNRLTKSDQGKVIHLWWDDPLYETILKEVLGSHRSTQSDFAAFIHGDRDHLTEEDLEKIDKTMNNFNVYVRTVKVKDLGLETRKELRIGPKDRSYPVILFHTRPNDDH